MSRFFGGGNSSGAQNTASNGTLPVYQTAEGLQRDPNEIVMMFDTTYGCKRVGPKRKFLSAYLKRYPDHFQILEGPVTTNMKGMNATSTRKRKGVWNRDGRYALPGSHAPLAEDLDGFLRRNPEFDPYHAQDRTVVWNPTTNRILKGMAAPKTSNLMKYFEHHSDMEVYSQDNPSAITRGRVSSNAEHLEPQMHNQCRETLSKHLSDYMVLDDVASRGALKTGEREFESSHPEVPTLDGLLPTIFSTFETEDLMRQQAYEENNPSHLQ